VTTASIEAGDSTNALEKHLAGARVAGFPNPGNNDSSLSPELADRGHARGGHDAWLVMLTDGAEVLVRTARPDDARALQAMHSRCSPESRYLRYFGSAAQLPATLLPVLLGRAPGAAALVAETRDRRLVGLANLVTNDDTTGEVALLVEDSWQRRGLGTAFVRRLVAIALDRDLHVVTAVTLRCNDRPARVLARAGLSVEVRLADDLLELRASLRNGTGYPASPNPGCACPPGPPP
jgi:RimJ/RimL family protein N-acetyltransferase